MQKASLPTPTWEPKPFLGPQPALLAEGTLFRATCSPGECRGLGQAVTQRAGSGLKDGILGVWENCPHLSPSQLERQFEIVIPSGLYHAYCTQHFTD